MKRYSNWYELNHSYCDGHLGITKVFKTWKETLEYYGEALKDKDNADFRIEMVEKIRRPFRKSIIIRNTIGGVE